MAPGSSGTPKGRMRLVVDLLKAGGLRLGGRGWLWGRKKGAEQRGVGETKSLPKAKVTEPTPKKLDITNAMDLPKFMEYLLKERRLGKQGAKPENLWESEAIVAEIDSVIDENLFRFIGKDIVRNFVKKVAMREFSPADLSTQVNEGINQYDVKSGTVKPVKEESLRDALIRCKKNYGEIKSAVEILIGQKSMLEEQGKEVPIPFINAIMGFSARLKQYRFIETNLVKYGTETRRTVRKKQE